MLKNRIVMCSKKVNDAFSAAMVKCKLQEGSARVFPYRFPCDTDLLPEDYKFVCSVKRTLPCGAKIAKNVYRDAKDMHHFIECK